VVQDSTESVIRATVLKMRGWAVATVLMVLVPKEAEA
jgi:hypothetical protein